MQCGCVGWVPHTEQIFDRVTYSFTYGGVAYMHFNFFLQGGTDIWGKIVARFALYRQTNYCSR